MYVYIRALSDNNLKSDKNALHVYGVYAWQNDYLHNNNKTLTTVYLHYIFIYMYMYTVPVCQNERAAM